MIFSRRDFWARNQEKCLDFGNISCQNKWSLFKTIFISETDIDFVCANAEVLPFENESFDAYTIGKKKLFPPCKLFITLEKYSSNTTAYGIRNVPRIEKALSEAHRVLKKGGKI